MNRRDFLTLVASAPIAALAPLPKFLADGELGLSIRYIKQWEIGPAIWSLQRDGVYRNGERVSEDIGFQAGDTISFESRYITD